MALSKLIKLGNEWKRVSLDTNEMQDVLTNLVEFNANEFQRCVSIAKKIDKKNTFNVATVLFDKQGLASFTAMSEALEEKINNLRDSKFGRKTEEAKLPEAPKPPEEPKEMEKKEGTTSDQIEVIKEEIKEPPKEAVIEPSPEPKPVVPEEPKEEVREIEVEEKKESPEEVSQDVFGNAWNPEKGKFEKKGE